MKPVVPAHVRAAERAREVERQQTLQLCANIVSHLTEAGWTNVKAVPKASFIAITGTDPAGRERSGAYEDGEAGLAEMLALGVPPPPRNKPEPEPVAPLGYEDEAPEPDDGEPLPDPLARLVPETIEQAKRKEWLRERHQHLNHLINGASTFGPPSEAVIREHQELERYRGYFA